MYTLSSRCNLRKSSSICGLINLCSFFSLFVASTSLAALEWKTTTQKIEVHPLQVSAVVPFEFTNTGDKPVTITKLKPNCGCITGEVDKKTYDPGESGSVDVVFNLIGRQGTQHKGIAVTTDAQPTKPVQLYIDTVVPKSYTPSVKRIVWASGEDHAPKTIRLTNSSRSAFPLEKALPSTDGVAVELKMIRDGFEYDLVITPEAGLTRTLVPIIIHPAKPDGMDEVRTYTVYALVK